MPGHHSGAIAPARSLSALVVDVHPRQSAPLVAMLEQIGTRTSTVDGGAAARRALGENRIDVMFVYERSWARDAEVRRLARDRAAPEHRPVVLVSDGTGEVAVAPGGDVDDLLRLPCTSFELSWRLANAARHHKRVPAYSSGAVPAEASVAEALAHFAHLTYGRNLASPHVQALFRPCEAFNGDVFLLARRPHGGVLAVLGDISGHGLAAAVFAPVVATLFHTLAPTAANLAAVLAAIDRDFHAVTPSAVSLALHAVELGPGLEHIEVANCAMPPLYLAAPAGQVRTIESHSIAAGVDPRLFLAAGTRTLPIETGERVLLYSDGMLDASDPRGRSFGAGRLRSAVQLAAVMGAGLIGEVAGDHAEFTRDMAASDDASVVEIACVPGLIVAPPAARDGDPAQRR